MTPSPASSNRRETKRLSGKVGPGCFRKYTKQIPWSVRNVRGRCGSSVPLMIRRSSETSSIIWDFGWQGQDRRQKLTPRQGDMTESCPHTPLAVSNFKHTLILSTATPNTPGMNTSSHNAF